MPKYIVRLDDACPQMDLNKWELIEKILDEYQIKPVVGVIPDCKDPDINHGYIDDFWTIVNRWHKKGWTIAQHGLNHKFFKYEKDKSTFQRNTEIISEFVGLSYEKQKEMINRGLSIMINNGITPSCFFAPAHTFDSNTVKVVRETKEFKYISDGYGLRPYIKDGVLFFPNNFDTPHRMIVGIHTFVIHPSNMTEDNIKHWSEFILNNHKNIISPADYLEKHNTFRRQGVVGVFIENIIHVARLMRNKIKDSNKELKDENI